MATVLSLALAVMSSVHAGGFPDKPIHWVVPFPPGGAVDAVSRVVARRMADQLGQPVTVENHAGAGGVIGSAEVARSAPDGYTLLSNSTGLAVDRLFFHNVPYEARKAFSPVVLLATTPSVLVVPAASPFHSSKQLLDFARAHPRKLTYASAGLGTSIYLASSLLASRADVQLLHIPYKGSSPAVADLIAGRVDMMIDSVAAQKPFIQAERVRALGVTSLQPSPLLPGVPPLAVAASLPGFEVLSWYGTFVPAGTPPERIKILNAAINDALKAPDVRKSLAKIGIRPEGGSPEVLAKLWHSEIDRWSRLVSEHQISTQ